MTENPSSQPNPEFKDVPPEFYTPPAMLEAMGDELLREFVGALNERTAKLYLLVMKNNAEASNSPTTTANDSTFYLKSES